MERTAEELGRAFPGAGVVVSRPDRQLPRVPAGRTLVLATAGIEYAAAHSAGHVPGTVTQTLSALQADTFLPIAGGFAVSSELDRGEADFKADMQALRDNEELPLELEFDAEPTV